MLKSVAFISTIALLFACGSTKKQTISSNIIKAEIITVDTIIWNEQQHDFKDVPSGPPAVTKFYFINKTQKNVTITSVEAGCSCTASEYTRTDIKPNDTAFITASYKTINTFGYFRKHLDVGISNGKKFHLLLVGNVDPMLPQK